MAEKDTPGRRRLDFIAPRALFLSLVLILLSSEGHGESRVLSVTWPTSHASPPVRVEKDQEQIMTLIRFGLAAVPESTVMKFSYLGSTTLGMPSEKAKRLHALLTRRYEEIEADPVFSSVDSALPYCYSSERPKTGLATVYVPAGADEKSDVILFLHGFGGSFLFYQHYLASIFPRHIIVCPAYGDSCSDVPGEYIRECMKAASNQIGWELPRPVLMGISAGGYGGFREYSRNPQAYLGYVCIASHPPPGVVAKIPAEARIRLVAGEEEPFVKNGQLAKAERQIKARAAEYFSRTIPGEDHFFLLSSEELTTKILLGWDAELRGAGR